jgi:hypothetical protein
LGLDAPEPAAAAEITAEPAVESAATTEAGTAEAEAGEQPGKQTESDGKSKVHLRFSELTDAKKVAEADAAKARDEAKAARDRAELAERQAAELRAKYEPPKPDELGPEPTRAQFANDAEFALALKDWAGESAIRERDHKEAAAKIERAWNERQAAVRAEVPDYDAVIAAGSNLVVSNEVRDAILESEQGPKILHHLAKNPDLVEELKRLPARSAVLRIGKLDAKFEAEKPQASASTTKVEPAKPVTAATEISRAPAPISPLKGGDTSTASAPIDSNGVYHGDYATWKRLRAEGKI